MRTKEYIEARKEFINCIVLSPICLFVPLIIAFTEWLPIMHAEKSKAAGWERAPIRTAVPAEHIPNSDAEVLREETAGKLSSIAMPRSTQPSVEYREFLIWHFSPLWDWQFMWDKKSYQTFKKSDSSLLLDDLISFDTVWFTLSLSYLFTKIKKISILVIKQPIRNIHNPNPLILVFIMSSTGNYHLGVGILDLE